MKMKILYRYDLNKTIGKHKIGRDCMPQLVERRSHGDLYRCTHGPMHDFYGYPMQKSAKEEEITNTRLRIVEWTEWLKKLTSPQST